ncbi:MAG: hypothetical protein OYK82_13445 [Gammaproteobacteria bacterium]|nr:hypothetical protein [Gammaproteobacteria bacterium]
MARRPDPAYYPVILPERVPGAPSRRAMGPHLPTGPGTDVGRFELAVAVVLLGLVVLRVLIVTILGLLILRPVRECPACFEPTVPIRWPLVLRLATGFEWRWCPSCRWQGPARKVSGQRASTGNRRTRRRG